MHEASPAFSLERGGILFSFFSVESSSRLYSQSDKLFQIFSPYSDILIKMDSEAKSNQVKPQFAHDDNLGPSQAAQPSYTSASRNAFFDASPSDTCVFQTLQVSVNPSRANTKPVLYARSTRPRLPPATPPQWPTLHPANLNLSRTAPLKSHSARPAFRRNVPCARSEW